MAAVAAMARSDVVVFIFISCDDINSTYLLLLQFWQYCCVQRTVEDEQKNGYDMKNVLDLWHKTPQWLAVIRSTSSTASCVLLLLTCTTLSDSLSYGR